jgi:DNA polymerase
MHEITLKPGADKAGFGAAVRHLISAGVPPCDISWNEAPSFFAATPPAAAPPVMLPRAVASLVDLVICHRNPERFALLYTLIWRTVRGERAVLEQKSDPLVHRLEAMGKAIRRDLHKMHAFLRFRRVASDAGERFIAWFEPDHYIIEATADFFVNRYRALNFSILTPVGSLCWDGDRLSFGPPGDRAMLPAADDFEAGWLTYYESIFNPARVNISAMRAEMPQKYWRNLPEARAIPALVRSAAARTQDMVASTQAAPRRRDPQKAVAAMQDSAPKTLAELNAIIAAAGPLVPGATQAVLGEGPADAAIVLVGEQPGDEEDIAGRPFVGPAGQLLNRALEDAGIDRGQVYLTNAVKHFKFEQRGKQRIHARPTAGEVKHYRWWLMRELDFLAPRVVVALGATALLALSGQSLPILRNRGPAFFKNRRGFVTVHPSYLLRLPGEQAKRDAYAEFVGDFREVKEALLF